MCVYLYIHMYTHIYKYIYNTYYIFYICIYIYKTTHILTIWSNNSNSWHLTKVLEIYVPTKTCTQIFIATAFLNCQNLEAAKMSSSS